AHEPPARVIPILLAPARVAPHRLKVTVGDAGNPHVAPRGSNGEVPDTPERVGVANGAAVGTHVTESPTVSHAADSRLVGIHVAKSGRASGLGRLGADLESRRASTGHALAEQGKSDADSRGLI